MPENRLSPREQEIARAYAAGDNYQRISERLCIAPSTVRTHLAAIYRKLEVSSKLELHRMLQGGAPQPRNQTDQAAIISELALSLEEAISRERALIEVLRIISGSQGEINEVIASLLGYALELCDAEFGIVFDSKPDGHFRASYFRGIPRAFEDWFLAQGNFRPGPDTGLGRMRKRRSGHIVTVSSVGGLVGQPFNEIYCGAKFAVEGYMEALASYVTPNFGINFTTVEPGGIRSDFAANILSHGVQCSTRKRGRRSTVGNPYRRPVVSPLPYRTA